MALRKSASIMVAWLKSAPLRSEFMKQVRMRWEARRTAPLRLDCLASAQNMLALDMLALDRLDPVRPARPRSAPCRLAPGQFGAGHTGADQFALAQVGAFQVDVAHPHPGKVHAGQVGAGQVKDHVGMVFQPLDQGAATLAGRLQVFGISQSSLSVNLSKFLWTTSRARRPITLVVI